MIFQEFVCEIHTMKLYENEMDHDKLINSIISINT